MAAAVTTATASVTQPRCRTRPRSSSSPRTRTPPSDSHQSRAASPLKEKDAALATIASAPWLHSAPLVVYWGDLDQDGLEILNEFRATGLTVESILMNVETYKRYQRYGTTIDPQDKSVKVHPARHVPHLNAEELALYELLSSGLAPVPRVEQERIPLDVPAALLDDLTASHPTT